PWLRGLNSSVLRPEVAIAMRTLSVLSCGILDSAIEQKYYPRQPGKYLGNLRLGALVCQTAETSMPHRDLIDLSEIGPSETGLGEKNTGSDRAPLRASRREAGDFPPGPSGTGPRAVSRRPPRSLSRARFPRADERGCHRPPGRHSRSRQAK